MRRIALTALTVAMTGLALTAAAQGMGGMGHGMGGMMESGDGRMMKGCPGAGMMWAMMMPQKVIATEDGGVIVAMGNRLIKFDKNLKLRNEVELEVDSARVQAMMRRMNRFCPAMQSGGAQQGGAGQPESEQPPADREEQEEEENQ
jgi:hypothetical protein